jgi:diacylglycerol kinase family enzyme
MMDLPSNDSLERREVIILANPLAGTRSRRRIVHDLAAALREHRLEVILCTQREELADLVASRSDQLRCIVASGGDGTLNEVLNRAPGTPVAILPLGNENLVARYFHQGRSAKRLADAIASAPVRHLDLGRAQGRFFSLMAGFGLDARVVHDVHRNRRGHLGNLGYVLPALRAVGTYSFPTIEVAIEETGEQLRGTMVFLFNLPVYGAGLPIGRKARGDDGWLDLLVFQRAGVFSVARYLAAIFSRCHETLPDVQYRRVKRVDLSAEQTVYAQIDGDPAGVLPMTVEVVPAAWHLLAASPLEADLPLVLDTTGR